MTSSGDGVTQAVVSETNLLRFLRRRAELYGARNVVGDKASEDWYDLEGWLFPADADGVSDEAPR